MRFLLILAIYFLANFYVFTPVYSLIPAECTVGKFIFIGVSLFISCSGFLVFLIPEKLSVKTHAFLYTIITSWFFVLIYAILLFLLLDAVNIIYPIHTWIKIAITFTVILVAFSYGNIKYKKKKRIELKIPITKPLKKSIKIIGISDLHLGYTINKKELTEWIKLINNEKPDIVLIAGDIIDANVRPLYYHELASYFNKIHAPLGIYACLGNHEYISGIKQSIEFLQKTNITLLQDSSLLIDDSFYLMGRDDKTNTHRKPLKELIKNTDPSKPIILLDHQPFGLEEAQENGIDLQLSGHTHRGQIWPISWITDKIYEVSHGFKKKGNTTIYVSSGIGIWGGKFRIGTQSEYVVIELSGTN